MSEKKDFGLLEVFVKLRSPIVIALLKTIAEKFFSSWF